MGIPLYRIPEIRSYYGKGEYTGGMGVEEEIKKQGQGQGQGQDQMHPKAKAKALLPNVSFDLEELMTTDAVAGDEQVHNPRWVSDAEAMYYGIGGGGGAGGGGEGDRGTDAGEPKVEGGKVVGKGGKVVGNGGESTREGMGRKGFVESLPLSGVPFDLEELMSADVDVYYGTGDYGKGKPVYGKEAKGFVAFKSPLVGGCYQRPSIPCP